MHNIDENEVLRNALSGLNEDIPHMPEGLHAAWMQEVEDDMESTRIEKARNRRAFTRFLSVAAAMVFVVGGTLLTRDSMDDAARTYKLRTSLEAEYKSLQAENGELAASAATSGEVMQKMAVYEDATVAANTAFTMARGASADSDDTLAVAESAEAEIAETTSTAAPAAEKKIIRTASLTIQTQSYEGSLDSLKAMCEADGGWIESSSENVNSSTGLRRAYLTLRIPQDALDGYLLGAEELGRITSRSETATDVTASYQDTQARLDTQLALMERLQALITESADLTDLLALESKIADTQYTIDSLQSSLNNTDRRVTYSTVDITLREEDAPALTDTTVSLSDRIAAALRMGWDALAGFAQDMLVFLIAALPFIGIVAALALIVALICKRQRRKPS